MSFLQFIDMVLAEVQGEVFKDTHKHRCGYAPRGEEPVRGCGLVIEHDRPGPGEDYERAHACPECGTINKWRYSGRVPVGQKRLKPRTQA